MLLVGAAMAFKTVASLAHTPQMLADFMLSLTENPLLLLLLVNLLLFVVGMFLDAGPAIIILGPILAPIAASYGIHPVHFGMIMITNLAVGMVTPPVGVNLFIACGIARITMEQLMRPLLVFLAVLIANLMAITYLPGISLAFLR